MADVNGKTLTVPYVPYKTFVATLDSFAKFMPHRIDTSIWSSYSGGMRSQLLSAYKFLGLITDDGTPKPELKQLADDEAGRPALLREILKRSYVDLLKLDLSKATPSSFDAELRKYGLEGDTHRKAMAFFLAAAKVAGIPLSPLLTQRGGMTTTRRPRPSRPPATKPKDNGAVQERTPPAVEGLGKTINLDNGITLSLVPSDDMFKMTKSDRQFVLELLDKLDEYEEGRQQDAEIDAEQADA